MIHLTTDHAASSYGRPVFVDEEDGLLEDAEGVRRLRREIGWSRAQMGEEMGVSSRTVEGWEQGRPISGPAIRLLRQLKAVLE